MVEEVKPTLTEEEIDDIDLMTEDEAKLFGNDDVIITADEEEAIPVSYENAEEALLAMFILDTSVAEYVAQSRLRDIHFIKRKNRLIFATLINLRHYKGVVNYDIVADALAEETTPDGQSALDYIGGLEELSWIIACVPPTIDMQVAQAYIDIIIKQYKLSQIQSHVRWIGAQRKLDDMKFIDRISKIQGILADDSTQEYGLVPLGYLAPEAYDRYIDRKANPDKYKAIDTGLWWLNRYKIISKKKTCVIGAKTNIGKSIIVSNMITRMVLAGYKVLLFTPELDKREYIDRMLCAEARVPIDKWKDADISNAENEAIGKVQYKLVENANGLFVEDRGSQSCGYIINSIKKHMISNKVDVIVVDYLQNLNFFDKGDNHRRSITMAVERFRAFAKDNDVAMIIISQLKRTSDAEPTKEDLKESGDIENLADSVVLVHRNSLNNPVEQRKGWYMIAKNRQGPNTERIPLEFNIATLKFTETDIPRGDVEDQGSLIGGYDDGVADEDRPTEQSVIKMVEEKDKEYGETG